MSYKIELNGVAELLNKWNKRLRESQFAHYQAERYYKKCHYFFGVPAIIFSAIAGSAVLIKDVYINADLYDFVIGFSGFFSSMLIGIQTFINCSELAEKHLSAAVKCGALRRSIEELLVMMQDGRLSEGCEREINMIRTQVNDLASNSPNVSKKIWKAAKRVMDEELKR